MIARPVIVVHFNYTGKYNSRHQCKFWCVTPPAHVHRGPVWWIPTASGGLHLSVHNSGLLQCFTHHVNSQDPKKRARDDDQTGCKQDKRLAKFTWWTVKLLSSACPRLNALGMRVVHHTHGQWVCSLLTFQMHILYFKDYQYIICFMQFLYLHCSPKPLKALTKRAECENANV